MGLIDIPDKRSDRQSDLNILSKTNISEPQKKIKLNGGETLLGKVKNITALVEDKLGHHVNEYEIITEIDRLNKYKDRLISYGISTIDVETDSLDPMTCVFAGLVLYAPCEKPAYIPINHISPVTNKRVEGQLTEQNIIDWFNQIPKDGIKWIMHNAKFDIRVLKNALNIDIDCYWDTFLAAKCIDENESAALKDLHFKYCLTSDSESFTFDSLFHGIPFTLVPIKTAYLYAAGDGPKTWDLYQYQLEKFKSLPDCYEVFKKIESPLLSTIVNMEQRGISLDLNECRRLSEKYNEQLTFHQQAFNSYLETIQDKINRYKQTHPKHKLDDPINIASPSQVGTLIYDILKIPPVKGSEKNGTGEKILKQIDHPVVELILNYREVAKLLSTYVEKLPNVVNKDTGKIHASFNQCGTDTGRMSSSSPKFGAFYGNID